MKKLQKQKLPHWLQSLLKPDVIKTMQIKFVATAMGILILVFIIMLGSINMIMKTVSQSQSMQLLQEIAESDRYDMLNNEPEPKLDKPSEEIPKMENLKDNIIALGQMPWYENNPHDNFEPPENKKPDNHVPDEQKPPYQDNWHEKEREREGERESEPRFSEFQESEIFTESNFSSENEMIPTEIMTQFEIPAIAEPYEPEFSDIIDIQEESVMTETEEFVQEQQIIETNSETESQEIITSESVSETENLTTTTEIIPKETAPKPPKNNFENHDFKSAPDINKWNVNIILDHFALMADKDGNFLGLRNTENYTDEQAEEILTAILNTEKQQGMYNWLQYYKTQKPYGILIVVAEKSSDQALLNNLFCTTIILGILMLLLLFIFLIVFSGWITKPVQSALERQKQFVSDAGHELKTPLTILTANADILKDEIGENKWLGYMQEQTDRMNQLVGDLLRLARMDNAIQEYIFEEFNLSTAIEATALPFECQAFELQKNLEMDIQPNISYYGSQQHIRQLTAIFIDNAMKYSNEHGIIKITLLQRGNDRILEFYNTGCEISSEETKKIFERFYRGDKARNNKGKIGYGLGLAIAKSIMEIHKIKIQVTCEQDAWIRFLLVL
ncbi:MAG: HAMP domain-containing histidine kinase, partial [Oscillospiraceae bacterium]|nr:HAMP domain-containing histidine kinase [Oscillospiraceae bacterium]